VRLHWDERMNQENIRKLGFDFASVWEIFELPILLDVDAREVFEQRLAGIGFLRQGIVAVIFAEGADGTIRIIFLKGFEA